MKTTLVVALVSVSAHLVSCGPTAEERSLSRLRSRKVALASQAEAGEHRPVVTLSYDISEGCFSLPDSTKVTLNGTTLRGHTGYYDRSGGCQTPVWDARMQAPADVTQAELVISDSDTRIKVQVADFFTARKMRQVGLAELPFGQAVTFALSPADDQIDRAAIWFSRSVTDRPVFYLDGSSLPPIRLESGVLRFTVPPTGEPAEGEFFVHTISPPLRVLTCENAEECSATLGSTRKLKTKLVRE